VPIGIPNPYSREIPPKSVLREKWVYGFSIKELLKVICGVISLDGYNQNAFVNLRMIETHLLHLEL